MKKIFRFIVMGDSSKHPESVNKDILSTHLSHIKTLSKKPQCIFFLGDMVYGGSNVSEQLEAWKRLVERFYPITMYYTVLGNHEDNESIFSNAFPHLPNEQLKGYKRTAYYIDFECARFIVLNSNRGDTNGGYIINSYQRAWLERTLAESNKKYNFIMLHVPPFPTGHHHGESLDNNTEERDAFWATIERYNVTAVFSGHEHNYSRRIIEKIPGSTIYQIITGGAGSKLNGRGTNTKDVIIGPAALYHFVVVDINNDDVYLKVYDKDSIIIDCCRLFPKDERKLSTPKIDILIQVNALWKYLDNGFDQGTSWREPGFDDTSWNSGLAELGYGDGEEVTVVSYGTNPHKKYITTYFRKGFSIDNCSIYKSLTLRIQKDDGAVVYLNGEEIYRTNMPSGVIQFNTVALRSIDGEEEKVFETVNIDTTHLKNGYNVIAVEVHQASASSSDLSFNFQLLGHKNN